MPEQNKQPSWRDYFITAFDETYAADGVEITSTGLAKVVTFG